MAPVGRKRDQLDLHDNVARRVRNLETGVHPVGSDLQYYDSIDPTLIDWDNANFTDSSGGVTDTRPYWLRRIGIVQIIGQVRMTGGQTISDLSAEEHVFDLPPEARPLIDMTFRGVLSVAPWSFQFRIQNDGEAYVIKPDADGADQPVFHFSGATYPTV